MKIEINKYIGIELQRSSLKVFSVFPVFLSSMNSHDYNVAMRIFGSPSLFASDLNLPTVPLNVV